MSTYQGPSFDKLIELQREANKDIESAETKIKEKYPSFFGAIAKSNKYNYTYFFGTITIYGPKKHLTLILDVVGDNHYLMDNEGYLLEEKELFKYAINFFS